MNELPAGWARPTLAEVADVRLGRQRSPKNHAGPDMRPYLRAANVTWQGLQLADVKEMNFSEDEANVYALLPGDVVLAEASGSPGEVGKPALWRGEIEGCCFQNTLIRVRSRGPLPEYLTYLFRFEALTGGFADLARGVGIHHLGASRLSSWSASIPPLAEQRRIVAAIEEQFSRLDAAEASLNSSHQRLVSLRASLLEQLIHGPTVELGSVTASMRYGTSTKCSYEGAGSAVLRIPNIQTGKVVLGDLKYATDPGVDLTLSTAEPGDLLVVRTNGSRDLIGRVACLRDKPIAFASYLIRVRLRREAVVPEFASIALTIPSARREIESRAATSAGQYNLNLGALRTLPIQLPPLEDQRRIVAEVERQLSIVDATRAAIDRALERSKQLRRSILGRAFTGRLVPQDPDDEPASALLDRSRAERAAQPHQRRPSRRRARMASSG